MSHTDIILVNIPVTGLQYPSAGTAQLKGVLQSNGFSSRIIDLNLDLFNQSGNEYQLYFDYLTSTGDLNEAQFEFLDSLFDKWVDQLIAFSPKYVGISIFTYQCQPSARILLSKLRLKFHGKIVIGGAGISTNGIASVYNDFGAEMLGSNLIDYFIRGDGEYALLELLKGNTDYPGINNDQYLQLSLDDVPMPEYDDLINLDYMYDNDQKILPINGSRGCVRKCMFCDIHEHWKKFTFRSGHVLAAEMIYNYEKYGVRRFTFTDSLINGSMKAFRDLLRTLIQYYKDNDLEDAFFRFNGQFICRNSKQQTDEDYVLMGKAGCDHVLIGVETGSESVREDMKKQFTTAELKNVLEQFEKNNITTIFSMISGYPTETIQDHQLTLDMFTEFQKYALNGTINGLNLGSTLSIDEGTPLYKEMSNLGLIHFYESTSRVGLNWVNVNNPDLTLIERIRRRIELQEHVTKLGYTVWNGDSHLRKLIATYEKIENGTY
jgi:hypothetical protein